MLFNYYYFYYISFIILHYYYINLNIKLSRAQLYDEEVDKVIKIYIFTE